MEKLLYWELGSNQLTEELGGGGSSFAWPELTQSETVILNLRCAERVGSQTSVETQRVVTHVRAAIGRLNGTAERGEWAIRIGDDPESGVNTIAPVPFDVSAEALAAAINDLDVVGPGGDYGVATVIQKDGSWILTFADAAAEVPIHVAGNSLFPACHVRRRAHEQDDVWYHEIRLVQVKAAFTSNYEERQVDAPVIAEFQGGSEVDGIKVNEIQKITFFPGFRGLYKVKRGLKPTVFLDQDDGPVELQEALAPLADEGGAFVVTRPTTNVGHIEFTGTMGGQPQDLLEVFDVQVPPPDIRVILDLDNSYCAALLRDSEIVDDRIDLPFELEIKYEDPEDDSRTLTWIYQATVTVRRELIYEGEADVAEIDYLRPVDPTGHVPFNPSQVANGQQFYSFLIGDGVKVAWLIDHQRHTKNVDVKLRENVDGGHFLVEGVDYLVRFDPDGPGDDAVLVTLLGDYATTPPGEGEIFGEVVARREVSAFQAGVTWEMAQINGLLAILLAMQAEIDELKALAPGQLGAPSNGSGGTAQKPVPHFTFIYPLLGRSALPLPTPGSRLSSIDVTKLPRVPPRIYPAVHDAAVSALPTVLEGGTRVPTEPVPENVGNVYENQTADPVELAIGTGWTLNPGEFAATDGETWYPVERYAAGESSYYPAHLARILFEDMVQPDELPPGSEMELRFPVELAMLMANTPVHCAIVIDTAQLTSDTTPGAPGSNLATQFWATPHLAQKLIVTAAPREYVFGYRVRRASNGDLSADKLVFGKWVATTAPATASFQIRVRLARLDTPNTVAAPTGLVAVAGGVPFAEGTSPDTSSAVGYLTIRS